MRLPPLPTLKDLLRLYGIRAQKSLSQNFLLDPNTLRRFALCSGKLENKVVVEVGPGPGGITRAILEAGADSVYVIEKDSRFLPTLHMLREASGNKLNIRIGDCLHFNISKLFDNSYFRSWDDMPPDIKLIGNLPFNVATPFVIQLFKSMDSKTNYFSYGRVVSVLTLQHEVAYRLIAPPGCSERCRLSVMAQNYADIQYKYTLPGAAFVPPPKVNVGVVVLTPLKKPFIEAPYEIIEKVVTTVLIHKRKNLITTVAKLFPPDPNKKLAKSLLKTTGIDPEKIPIDLDLNDFEKIVYTYIEICQQDRSLSDYSFRDPQSIPKRPPVKIPEITFKFA